MRRIALLLLGAGVGLGEPAGAQNFETLRVAAGLDRPVFLTAAPDDGSRVFVVEQHTGRILILRRPSFELAATPFLTVGGLATGEEQGLLGLAFDPDYASNGFFYVDYTDPDTRIVRYHVSADPDVADPASATPVLGFDQPQSNHNGGWIGFGPDGYFYVATGDGGGSYDDDPGHTSDTGNAQDLTDNLLGKLLRIDVGGDDFPADDQRNYAIPADNPFVGVVGDDEIWAYGLRNPWRVGFDRLTGDLYIGDVGQGSCEELDVQPAASAGGENYGWRLREGVIQTPLSGVGGPAPPGAIEPIFDYPHQPAVEPCSDPEAGFDGYVLTGGYVYCGPVAALAGRYFLADYSTGRLWSLRWDGSDPRSFDGTNYVELTDHAAAPEFTPDLGAIGAVSSFGEDSDGNLYVLDLDGEIFYIPEPPAGWLHLVAVAATLLLGRRRMRRSAAAGRREND